jgi:TonB family protein
MSAAAKIRHLAVVSLPSQTAASPSGPDVASIARDGVLVDVVALTADMTLFQSVKEAVGERNPVWRARTADEAADLLITGRCGVLLIDMESVSSRGVALIEQIVEQFPDVVVCVAGTREDEPSLVPLISDGSVYRFVHKPASARRAAMFLQAAIKRHLEHRGGRPADEARSLLRSLTRAPAGLSRKYLLAFVAVCAALVSLLFIGGSPHLPAESQAPMLEHAATPTPDPIPTVASQRADPVLSRARAALQAGRLESPQGRNALDLFEAVLLAQPDHVEARAGLAKTIDVLLRRARSNAAAGRKAEAERVLQRVLAVVPEHEGAKRLLLEVNPPDLPSRQLAREQVAEVRQREMLDAAVDAGARDRLPPAMPPPAAAGPLPEPVSSAYLARARSAPPPTPVVTRAAVETDPLSPRYVNSTPAKRVASWRRHPPTGNDAPVRASLPIAGLASEAAAETRTPPPATTAAVPADAFDRVHAPDPVYPAHALRQGTRGWVELEFTVTSAGAVSDIEVVGAEPYGVFEQAATDALAQWRFRPRLVNGQPVAQRSTIKLRFDVDD